MTECGTALISKDDTSFFLMKIFVVVNRHKIYHLNHFKYSAQGTQSVHILGASSPPSSPRTAPSSPTENLSASDRDSPPPAPGLTAPLSVSGNLTVLSEAGTA